MEAELKRLIDNLQRVLDVSFDQKECRAALKLQNHYRSLLRIFQRCDDLREADMETVAQGGSPPPR